MVGGGKIHPREACSLTAAVVAFQAESEDYRTAKQPAIGRSVRVMASLAPFDDGGWVLIDEWPAPVAMAFQAGLIVEGGRFHHRSGAAAGDRVEAGNARFGRARSGD